MPLLYYWRPDNYRRDLDMGAAYHLNQASPVLHEVDAGDSLWAFTRSRAGEYALAAELVVQAKTRNRPGYRYGGYRLWGDVRRSRYLAVDGQPGAEAVIRSLSVRADSDVLGRAFQGCAAVRRLDTHDHQMLAAWATDLRVEPRARLLAEERLELALYEQAQPALEGLLIRDGAGLAERRRQYLHTEAPSRSRRNVEDLQRMYGGHCQVCLWDPRGQYGEHLSHGHHIRYLSRGGEDVLDNMVLLCPNHRAAVHRCDAPLDFADLAFAVADHREPVVRDRHLRPDHCAADAGAAWR
ncbi:MAG: hypothetical protein FJX72_08500 [Armatimonadetes bacterium]|nr:hypothetical protein [Armatimonadota bacterium]